MDILENNFDEPENKEKDFLDRIKETLPLFFASGQSLTIRTNAIPKDLFEKIEDEEIEGPKKAKKLILDTELEFDNLLPQNLLFSFFFNEFINKEENNVDNYVKIISKDIFLNATEGNYKYKISPSIFENENYPNDTCLYDEIFKFFRQWVEDIIRGGFHIYDIKEYNLIDFNEIGFTIISQKYKTGFSFEFKLPQFNELINDLVKREKEIFENEYKIY